MKPKLRWEKKNEGFNLYTDGQSMPFAKYQYGIRLEAYHLATAKRACKLLVEAMLRGKSK